jgi:hypothetical protein
MQLDHIQELQVDHMWNQEIMMEFVPYRVG